MTLRDLNARIHALEDAEQLRQNTEAALLRKRLSRGLGVLGSWGAGKNSEQAHLEAAARQLGAHRESVIWYLRTRLQETARTQQRMMETRLTREMEKNRSVLAKTRSTAVANGMHGTANGSVGKPPVAMSASGTRLPVEEEEKRWPMTDTLTDDQKQMFEKGNQDMVKYLESTLDKVRQVDALIPAPVLCTNYDAGLPKPPSSRLQSSRTCSSTTSRRNRRTLTIWLPIPLRQPRVLAKETRS